MERNYKTIPCILLTIFIVVACGGNTRDINNSFVNTAHLDHLYEEVVIADQPMAIIHIYADYPDYNWVDVPEEGTACVDDVARAAVFYLYHHDLTGNHASLEKAKNLLNFILYMQAENGLFYNFVYTDLSINFTRENSRAKANWWTWRAIWAMSEALSFFRETNPVYMQKLKSSIEKTFPAIDSILTTYPQFQQVNGLDLPTWLPGETAADQASVLQLALIAYQRQYPQSSVKEKMEKISAGLMAMQTIRGKSVPYGVFLSWRNTWHDWGNCQAAALLSSANSLGNRDYLSAALMEVDLFHPYLKKCGYLNQFEVGVEGDHYVLIEEKKYPQIAYGIRPLVWANLFAYESTGNNKYVHQAAEIACWLLGKNDSGEMIYDPKTGRCFDGIDATLKINKNAGAESTIEALLTLILTEKNPLCASIIQDYYQLRSNP